MMDSRGKTAQFVQIYYANDPDGHYLPAIMGDLSRFTELQWNGSRPSQPDKIIIYLDYGFNEEINQAISTHAGKIPIFYRRLGLVAPRYTNQWKEYPGCPSCGHLARRLKEDDHRWQCPTCLLETTWNCTSKWTTLDRGAIIENLHKGESYCAILGGGSSVLDHQKHLPKGTTLMGINHHFPEQQDICDYLVFNDKATHEKLKGKQGKLISRWLDLADLHLPLIPRGRLSSLLGTEIALSMGFSTILLCGMDCSAEYINPSSPKRADKANEDPEWHLLKWRTLQVPKGQRVALMGPGPLEALFPLFAE